VEEDRAESRISKVREQGEVKEHFATEKHSKVRATEDGVGTGILSTKKREGQTLLLNTLWQM